MLKKGWFYYAAAVMGYGLLLWIATFFTHRLILFVPLLGLATLISFFVLVQGIRKREHSSLDDFWRKCCKPVFSLTVVWILYAFFNFFISGFIMGGGGPEKTQSGFFLTSHGDVLRELTEEDYIRLKKVELRMLLGHITIFSGISLTYLSARVPELWGRKKKEEPQDDRIIYLNKE